MKKILLILVALYCNIFPAHIVKGWSIPQKGDSANTNWAVAYDSLHSAFANMQNKARDTVWVIDGRGQFSKVDSMARWNGTIISKRDTTKLIASDTARTKINKNDSTSTTRGVSVGGALHLDAPLYMNYLYGLGDQKLFYSQENLNKIFIGADGETWGKGLVIANQANNKWFAAFQTGNDGFGLTAIGRDLTRGAIHMATYECGGWGHPTATVADGAIYETVIDHGQWIYIKPGQDTGLALMSAGYHSPASYTSLGLGIMQTPYFVISGNQDSLGLLRVTQGIKINKGIVADSLITQRYADSAAAYTAGVRPGRLWNKNGQIMIMY
jgi:hypothetical protein